MDENINQQNNKKNVLPNIKTYTSDMADAIREKEISVIKIAMAEKEKREREELVRAKEETGTSKFFLVAGGIILLLGAVVGLYFLSMKKKQTDIPVVTLAERKTIISYNENSSFSIFGKNNSDILEFIKTESNKIGNPKSIRTIFLTEKINDTDELLGVEKFFSVTDLSIPAPIKRSLGTDYMFGVFTPSVRQAPTEEGGGSVAKETKTNLFLILRTTDYNISYAGMLEWENTMSSDLDSLFGKPKEEGVTTENSFKDTLINNKDARVLYNTKGEVILYYLFVDKNTLIITDGNEAIKELTSRIINKS